MKVRLKGITMPQDIEGVNNPEEFIAYCARVSNPEGQINTLTAPKLMAYLMRNAHWSPFEMVSVCLEIETTRDIGRQILRHRSFSFQEFSQRYASVEELQEMFEKREARLQDPKNRQNSIKTEDLQLSETWREIQANLIDRTEWAYKWALSNGIAKEQARVLLPEGLTKTRMYMAGSLRSWIHYCDLRCANGTQLEHMQVAEEAKKVLRPHFPNIFKVLDVHS